MPRARLPFAICAGLLALVVVAYGPLWRNDFIDLDDEVYITKNPHILGGLTPGNVCWAWTTFHAGFWFPLTWMSLQLDATLFGAGGPGAARVLWAPGFHAQNLLWHAATVLLLFEALRRMTGAVWRSALVAALFAVHPLHVESVAWATERKDTLSAFFWVLTLLAYARYAAALSPHRYAAVAAAFVLGLLAKPMLVTLPFALLLLDWWPLRRWVGRRKAKDVAGPAPDAPGPLPPAPFAPAPLGRLILEKLPLIAVSVAAGVLTVIAQRHGKAVIPFDQMPLPARLANAVVSCGWYLEKTFWPTGLALFYPHPGNAWHWGPVLAAGAVLLAVTLAAALAARRMPWLAVGWLWFLGTLLPVSGLLQVGFQARADRFVYVPHIGLFLAVVWTAAALADRLSLPAAVRAAAAAACLAALAAGTWVQVGYWKDTPTAWRHALAVTRDNHRAHANLGRFLSDRGRRAADPREQADLLDQARAEYEQAVALMPGVPEYQYDLGTVLLLLGRPGEAADHFTEAVRRDRTSADAWHNLGTARLRQGRLEEAARAFRAALEVNPGAADSRAGLGLALWRLGRRGEAEREWEAALRLDPQSAQALAGTGLVRLWRRRPGEAARWLTAAVRANPSLAWAWSARGVALGRLQEWGEALASHGTAVEIEDTRARALGRAPSAETALYRRRLAQALRAAGRGDEAAREYAVALRLDPGWPEEAAAEAWRLATDPRPEERDPATAAELAGQVCQALADPPAEALDALAAALAADGHYDQAADVARQALAKAPPGRARAIAARLKLYEQGKPYVAAEEAGPGE
jgi:tetratricopeptide (TPR) repeat protein